MKTKLSVVLNKNKRKKPQPIRIEEVAANEFALPDGSRIDTEYELLSYLLPENVKAFYRELSLSVEALCGARYEHSEHRLSRWGKQPGSIVLGNQRVAIERPRVREGATGKEVRIPFYEKMQNPESFDRAAFQSALKKCSQPLLEDLESRGLPERDLLFVIDGGSVLNKALRDGI